jgi:hypothetical protein
MIGCNLPEPFLRCYHPDTRSVEVNPSCPVQRALTSVRYLSGSDRFRRGLTYRVDRSAWHTSFRFRLVMGTDVSMSGLKRILHHLRRRQRCARSVLAWQL